MHSAQLQGFPVAMPAGMGFLLVPQTPVVAQGQTQLYDPAWAPGGATVRLAGNPVPRALY